MSLGLTKDHLSVDSLLCRTAATSPSGLCARTFISYSAPTSAKFPERISKRLLCKVRNTHGDELFGRSRAHRTTVKRTHRRHMWRTATGVACGKDARTAAHEQARSVHVRVHTCTGCSGAVFIAPEGCCTEITCETLVC